MLAKKIKKNGLLAGDDLVASCELVKDLFQYIAESLSVAKKQIFIDFKTMDKLKGNLVTNHSFNFG